MPTVFEVLLQTGRRLDALIESTATATGTTATLIDTYLASGNGFSDDQYNGGSLFLKATSTIPAVSDFAVSSGTVTFTPAAAVAPAAGAAYGLMSKRFPYGVMLSKLNEVLTEIRDYVTTTEVLVSALTFGHETAVADTVKIVEVLAGQASTTDRQWTRLTNWQHSRGILRIDADLEETQSIAIRRIDNAPTVTAPSGTISDAYSTAWLALATAVKCLRWRLSQPGSESQLVTLLLNQLINDEARERAKNRLANPVVMRMQLQDWPEW